MNKCEYITASSRVCETVVHEWECARHLVCVLYLTLTLRVWSIFLHHLVFLILCFPFRLFFQQVTMVSAKYPCFLEKIYLDKKLNVVTCFSYTFVGTGLSAASPQSSSEDQSSFMQSNISSPILSQIPWSQDLLQLLVDISIVLLDKPDKGGGNPMLIKGLHPLAWRLLGNPSGRRNFKKFLLRSLQSLEENQWFIFMMQDCSGLWNGNPQGVSLPLTSLWPR